MFAISPFASRLTDRLGAGRLVLVGVGVTSLVSTPTTDELSAPSLWLVRNDDGQFCGFAY